MMLFNERGEEIRRGCLCGKRIGREEFVDFVLFVGIGHRSKTDMHEWECHGCKFLVFSTFICLLSLVLLETIRNIFSGETI